MKGWKIDQRAIQREEQKPKERLEDRKKSNSWGGTETKRRVRRSTKEQFRGRNKDQTKGWKIDQRAIQGEEQRPKEGLEDR